MGRGGRDLSWALASYESEEMAELAINRSSRWR